MLTHTLTPETVAAFAARPTSRVPSDLLRRAHAAAAKLPTPDACAGCGVLQGPTRRGRPVVEWHHPDYDFPSACVGLCASCHRRTHRSGLPEPLTGRVWPGMRGATLAERDAEAVAYAATITGPVRRYLLARKLTDRHDRAVKMGLLVGVGPRRNRHFWPAHLAPAA
jgi:hypothetical protein